MDQEILVRMGHALVSQLDKTSISPIGAMWVNKSDSDIWRLWIVPRNDKIDKNEFYRIVSTIISDNREKMEGLDVGSIDMMNSNHPVMSGMKHFMRMEGLGSAFVSNNTFNGFFLPNGIILRMAL